MSIFKDQWDFMQLAEQTAIGSEKQVQLYDSLIEEEYSEFADSPFDSAEEIKEAVDILVVTAGFLISRLGVGGAQHVWNLVHETNLAKVKGDVEKRSDGKILQNDEYKKVLKKKLMGDLEALLDEK